MNLDSRDLPAHLFQLSHSRNKKNRERNKRLKIWQRTKICIRKICIERKILSPKIFLNALLLKLVVNDCVALVSCHLSPQRWYSSILFQVHPDTSSDLFSDPSPFLLVSRFKKKWNKVMYRLYLPGTHLSQIPSVSHPTRIYSIHNRGTGR